jgi:hypothetical protein
MAPETSRLSGPFCFTQPWAVPTRNRLVADANEGNEGSNDDATALEALRAENAALLASRNEVLKEAKKAKEQARRFDGIDPDRYKQLESAAEEAERKRIEAVGDWKARETQLLEKVGKDIEARDTRINSLSTALERRLVDAEATAALASAKGSTKVLLPHIKSHVKVVEEDGEFVVHVVDAKGNQRIGDAKGSPMTIAQLVEEMKADPDFARNFEGSGSSGGGAPRSNAGGGGGVKTIAAGDNAAFLANVDGILDGTVKIAG